MNAKNNQGITPLMNVAKWGNLELCKFLITKGADINAKDKQGKTAFNYASSEVKSYLHSLGSK